jgi:hypothetical protein
MLPTSAPVALATAAQVAQPVEGFEASGETMYGAVSSEMISVPLNETVQKEDPHLQQLSSTVSAGQIIDDNAYSTPDTGADLDAAFAPSIKPAKRY